MVPSSGLQRSGCLVYLHHPKAAKSPQRGPRAGHRPTTQQESEDPAANPFRSAGSEADLSFHGPECENSKRPILSSIVSSSSPADCDRNCKSQAEPIRVLGVRAFTTCHYRSLTSEDFDARHFYSVLEVPCHPAAVRRLSTHGHVHAHSQLATTDDDKRLHTTRTIAILRPAALAIAIPYSDCDCGFPGRLQFIGKKKCKLGEGTKGERGFDRKNALALSTFLRRRQLSLLTLPYCCRNYTPTTVNNTHPKQ